MDDREEASRLMDQACVGDDAAFGRLAGFAQDGLFRFSLALGLGHADAADAVQETLTRAWSGRGGWRAGSDAVAWLNGIAMNVVRESVRRRGGQAKLALDLPYVRQQSGESPDNATGEDDMARLTDALARLPDRQREAVTCRFLMRMSITQTAVAMGCAEGTVKSAVAAALENLRGRLEHRP